jgi:dTDP-4-amino-4,6-dideoxygalactose transaminase
VIPVHLAGQVADMPSIAAIARKAGLDIVEDACHALATETDWGSVGNCAHSDIACFSLHPAKTVAMGEGGMATTNDAKLARAMVQLRSHGMSRDAEDLSERDQAFDENGQANPWYYEMHQMGFNYRAPDIVCALGTSQMRRLESFAARRRALASRYDRLLAPLSPTVRPIARSAGCKPVWHLYPVLVDFTALGKSRAAMMRFLDARAIGSQVHYLPLHRQPYYRKRYGALELPGADGYYARTLSLPLFAAMTDADVDRVVDAVGAFVQRRN